ncbi:MAG: sigma-70 family RNA polymerase sigma factor [Planctomycetia bacterium]|nr:MAG: sigma-70 family RNA polymerase sigma factor [Planctomycetia bacterium]
MERPAAAGAAALPSPPPTGTSAGEADAVLVASALAGQREAFDVLIVRHQRRAVAVAHRLLGDLHDALESVQDSFLRAYRNLASLEDPSRFGGWLLRIVTTQALNFRRGRALRSGARVSFEDCLIGDDADAAERFADTRPDADRPGEALAAAELEQCVQRALDELPDAQRKALVLFSMQQLPQREVAEIMDCSVEMVKWNVFQARRRMRERLAAFL